MSLANLDRLAVPEPGTFALLGLGLIGLGASQAMLLDLGVANIAAAILDLGDDACRRLAALGATVFSHREPACASGIVQFALPGVDSEQARARCLEQGVVLACRNGRLRISPHGYNTPADLDRLIAALKTL